MRDNYKKRVTDYLDKLIAKRTVDNFLAKYYKRQAPLEATVADSYKGAPEEKKGILESALEKVYKKKKPEPEYQAA